MTVTVRQQVARKSFSLQRRQHTRVTPAGITVSAAIAPEAPAIIIVSPRPSSPADMNNPDNSGLSAALFGG